MAILQDNPNKTIQIDISETSPYLEGNAPLGAGILPGMLVEIVGDAGASIDRPVFQAHSVSGGKAEALFAIETLYDGERTATWSDYGDGVRVRACRRGDLVWAWVPNTLQINIGEYLVSNGDGLLKPYGADEYIVAMALEKSEIGGDTYHGIKVEVS